MPKFLLDKGRFITVTEVCPRLEGLKRSGDLSDRQVQSVVTEVCPQLEGLKPGKLEAPPEKEKESGI